MQKSFARHLLWIAVACSAPLAMGCGAEDADSSELVGVDEDVESTADALTGSRPVGSTLKTTAALNLRKGAGTGYGVLVVMPKGATVTVVRSAPVSGWYNVKYGTRTGWASGQYLTAPAASSGSGGTAKKVKISGPAVRAHVQAFANAACAAYGCPYEIGTRVGHDPSADRAIDMMMSKYGTVASGANSTRGTNISSFALRNAKQYKLYYVIWRQRINTNDGRGWRFMANRGSNTANHYDHVHLSFNK